MKCFEKGKLSPFPAWELRDSDIVDPGDIIKEVKVKVFCSCRMPEDKKRKMAQCTKCREWFHQDCESISESVFKKRAPFTCAECLL